MKNKKEADKIIEDLWLSHVAFVISKAGGFIKVDRLRDMRLQEFAMICGRNGIIPYSTKAPIIPPEIIQELLIYGLEGAPEIYDDPFGIKELFEKITSCLEEEDEGEVK